MIDQDPPPEGNWLYRRLYVYALSVALVAILLTTILLTPRADLQAIAGWLIGLLALLLLVYLIAPSAAELGRLMATLPAFIVRADGDRDTWRSADQDNDQAAGRGGLAAVVPDGHAHLPDPLLFMPRRGMRLFLFQFARVDPRHLAERHRESQDQAALSADPSSAAGDHDADPGQRRRRSSATAAL